MIALDYEAFEALAIAEGARIVEAAIARHGAIAGRCVHRLGPLAVGDVAVWVGVAARTVPRLSPPAARSSTRSSIACRSGKEHYADGDSGWVNCEHAAATPRRRSTIRGSARCRKWVTPGRRAWPRPACWSSARR